MSKDIFILILIVALFTTATKRNKTKVHQLMKWIKNVKHKHTGNTFTFSNSKDFINN